MRPGKLFRIETTTNFWPVTYKPKIVRANSIILVVDTQPEKFQTVAKFYGLERPWLVLIEDKTALVDITNKTLLDVTPFIDKNGNPYILDYFLE